MNIDKQGNVHLSIRLVHMYKPFVNGTTLCMILCTCTHDHLTF